MLNFEPGGTSLPTIISEGTNLKILPQADDRYFFWQEAIENSWEIRVYDRALQDSKIISNTFLVNQTPAIHGRFATWQSENIIWLLDLESEKFFKEIVTIQPTATPTPTIASTPLPIIVPTSIPTLTPTPVTTNSIGANDLQLDLQVNSVQKRKGVSLSALNLKQPVSLPNQQSFRMHVGSIYQRIFIIKRE